MICPKCLSESPSNFKYCGFCGHSLETPPTANRLPQDPSDSSPHKTSVAGASSAGRDERREVTVLFADVSGFTAMSEKLDPEDVHSVMNDVFEGLGRVVYEEDGYIDKYIGDNIMVLFGAPVAHDDDPARACRAALRMQQFLAEFGGKNRRRTGVELRMRIGINCGLVVAGGIGSNIRMDYSVMGDTVNLASRLESNAPPGGILVSSEIAKRALRHFQFGPVQMLKVKGKEKPIKVYVLLRENMEPEFLPPRIESGVPYVGREAELARIEKLLSSPAAENHWIEICGEAGLGKSPLVNEAVRRIKGAKVLTVTATAQSHHQPFGLTRRLLQVMTREMAENRPVPKNSLELAVILEPLGAELNPYVEALWYLMAPRSMAPQPPDPDPRILRRILEKGTTLFLVRFAKYKPGIAFFFKSYDLADEASAELIERLGSHSDGWPLMIIVTRQERRKINLPNQTVIQLMPLPMDAAGLFLDKITRNAKLPETLRRDILDRAGGVPLYIEELVYALIDEGILKANAEGTGWLCESDSVAISLPPTIFNAMVARLDRLQAPHKDLLGQCSVQGMEFDVSLVKLIRLMPKWQGPPVETLLSDLEQLGLVERIASLDLSAERWSFCQLLMREASYQTMLLRERRELHASTAEVLRKQSHVPPANFAERLAYHHERAEQWFLAAEANLLAGNHAAEMFLNDHALQRYKHAAELADKIEAPQARDIRVKVAALAGAARILLRVGNYPEAEKLATAMRAVSRNPADQADADRFCAAICVHTGSAGKAEIFLLQALEMVRHETENVAVQWWTLFDLAGLYYRGGKIDQAMEFIKRHRQLQPDQSGVNSIHTDILEGKIAHTRGRFPEAMEFFAKAYDAAQRIGSASDLANASNNLGTAARDLGDYKTAEEHFQKALTVWSRIGMTESIAGAHLNLGNLAISQGNFDGARDQHQLALKAFREIGNIRGISLAQINLAIAALEKGDGAEAIADARAAIDVLGDFGNDLLRGQYLVVLGEGYLASGDSRNAEETFTKVIGEYTREIHPLAVAGAWRGLGRLALSRNDPNGARKLLDQVLQGYEQLRREQEAARTMLYRAEALWRSGDRSAALSEVERAKKRFEAIGAKLDIDRADRLYRMFANNL